MKHDASSAPTWIAAAGILLASALVAFRPIAGWDIWWHLRTGEQILSTGTWLTEDPFSHSFAGEPWRYKDGIADVVLWLFWRAGGPTGLFLLRTLLISVIGLSLIDIARVRGRAPGAGVLPFALFLLSSQNLLIVRPSLFTVALLSVLLALTHRLERGLNRPHAYLIGIAAVPWLSMVFHRGGVFLTVVVLGFALWVSAAHLLRPLARPALVPLLPHVDQPLARVWAAAIVAVTLGFCTPNGSALYATTFDVTGNDALREAISEWTPLSWDIVKETLPALPVMAGLAIAAWLTASLVGEREERPGFWLVGVTLVTGWMALGAVRHVPLFAMSCAALLAATLPVLAARAPLRPSLVVLIGVAAALVLPSTTRIGDYTIELPEERYPTAALSYARDNELGERVHHAFVFGGWVIWDGWPDYRALIDGRNDMVYPVEFFLQCTEAQQDPAAFAALAAEIPADWVLADNTAGRQTHGFLAVDPAWMLVHWDAVAVVYVRRDDHPELADDAFRFVYPPNPVASLGSALQAADGDPRWLGAIEAELFRMRESAPRDVRPLSLLVLFYDAVGALPQRDAAWTTLQDMAPEHPAVQQLGARLNLL